MLQIESFQGDVQVPLALKSVEPRRGKWISEEEAFTARVISDFHKGLLDIPPGITLRQYLSLQLNCDPMRITKKFARVQSIGKCTYVPLERTRENIPILKIAHEEFIRLRNAWYEKLFCQDREFQRKGIRSSKPEGELNFSVTEELLSLNDLTTGEQKVVSALKDFLTESDIFTMISWLRRSNNALRFSSSHQELEFQVKQGERILEHIKKQIIEYYTQDSGDDGGYDESAASTSSSVEATEANKRSLIIAAKAVTQTMAAIALPSDTQPHTKKTSPKTNNAIQTNPEPMSDTAARVQLSLYPEPSGLPNMTMWRAQQTAVAPLQQGYPAGFLHSPYQQPFFMPNYAVDMYGRPINVPGPEYFHRNAFDMTNNGHVYVNNTAHGSGEMAMPYMYPTQHYVSVHMPQHSTSFPPSVAAAAYRPKSTLKRSRDDLDHDPSYHGMPSGRHVPTGKVYPVSTPLPNHPQEMFPVQSCPQWCAPAMSAMPYFGCPPEEYYMDNGVMGMGMGMTTNNGFQMFRPNLQAPSPSSSPSPSMKKGRGGGVDTRNEQSLSVAVSMSQSQSQLSLVSRDQEDSSESLTDGDRDGDVDTVTVTVSSDSLLAVAASKKRQEESAVLDAVLGLQELCHN
eukprot:gene11879-24890_t